MVLCLNKEAALKKKIKKNKFSHKKTSGSWGFTGKVYYITKREHRPTD